MHAFSGVNAFFSNISIFIGLCSFLRQEPQQMYHKHDGAEALVGLFKFTVASKTHIKLNCFNCVIYVIYCCFVIASI